MKKINYLENFDYAIFLDFAKKYAKVGSEISDVKSYNYNRETEEIAINFSCADGNIIIGIFYPFSVDFYMYDQEEEDGLKILGVFGKEWQQVVIRNTRYWDEYLSELNHITKNETHGNNL